jgi:hypothetical protein
MIDNRLACPVNIHKDREELHIQPNPQSNQFISRSAVQAILDSSSSLAGQFALELILQSILDSGVQLIPKLTIQLILSTTGSVESEPTIESRVESEPPIELD